MTGIVNPTYVTSLDELLWGIGLIALTMAIHGFGVLTTLRSGAALQRWHGPRQSFLAGISTVIIATWILVIVHLFEVLVWALFFRLQHAFANASIAFYYALMQYTTVGSNYEAPARLQLVGGMIAMAGMLTFAWSTSVLFMLARNFQTQQLERPDRVSHGHS